MIIEYADYNATHDIKMQYNLEEICKQYGTKVRVAYYGKASDMVVALRKSEVKKIFTDYMKHNYNFDNVDNARIRCYLGEHNEKVLEIWDSVYNKLWRK